MPVTCRVTPASLSFTILAIGNAKVSLRKAGGESVRAAGKVYQEAVYRNITLTDHTLGDLARLDHPYARRHGGIRIHGRSGGGYISDGTNLVHTHGSAETLTTMARKGVRKVQAAGHGAMAAALRGSYAWKGPSGGPEFTVDFDTAAAPEALDVIMGTARMLPRDPLWSTATAPATRHDMRVAIVTALGKALRSQAHVRFTK